MDTSRIQQPCQEAPGLSAHAKILRDSPDDLDSDSDSFPFAVASSAPVIVPRPVGLRRPLPPLSDLSTCRSKPRVRLDWDEHRATITQLYLVDGFKLNDVKRIMCTQHGFEASISRYKKKLTVWGLRKNYTKIQKENAIGELLRDLTTKDHAQHLLVNSKPLKKDRILRYLREQRKGGCLTPHEPTKVTARDTLGTVHFTFTTDSDCVEQTLLLAGQYYSWYFGPSNKDRIDLTYSEPYYGVCVPILDARQYLRADPSRSFRSLDEACSNFQRLLHHQPFQLLPYLVAEFSRDVWRRARHVVEALFSFVAAMSRVTLGDSHPVSRIIDLFQSDAALQSGASRVILFWIEGVIEPYLGSRSRPYLQLIRNGGLQSTTNVEMEKRKKQHLRDEALALQYLLLRARVTLGILYHDEKQVGLAENVWETVINEAFGVATNDEIENEGITACYLLGWLYKACGKISQCQKFLTLGMRRALQSPSHGDAYPQIADPVEDATQAWQLRDPEVKDDVHWVWNLLETISQEQIKPVGRAQLCAEWKICMLRRMETWEARGWA